MLSAPKTAEPCSEGKLLEFPAKTDQELAEYVWSKLNLATYLACQGEQERRSGHRASAEDYQRKWEQEIAEVKRLLPLVKKNAASFFAGDTPQKSRPRQELQITRGKLATVQS